ncbi:H(+)-transporting V0 sector ATPase subunit e [Claviceps africana]|uniref:H(+)-transporting V0 sector ATPase subunit e n=1 Tax=Claviceps africana TaxID=83212 RepID=A0A8K0NK12_9HYPO|nr:H(+)-transporting V0 sector ATPase subunit e [Claviceps africana]
MPIALLSDRKTGDRGTDANVLDSLWRSSLILSIVSCYLMWAITFLAQLHPLIAPKRNDLREEFLGH